MRQQCCVFGVHCLSLNALMAQLVLALATGPYRAKVTNSSPVLPEDIIITIAYRVLYEFVKCVPL